MNKRCVVWVGWISLAAAGVAAAQVLESDRAELIHEFDRLTESTVQATTNRPLSNDDGGIAWGISQQLSGLAEAVATTGEAKYAERFIRLADHVLAARDNRLDLRDEYRKIVSASWSSTKYSDGKRYVWAVHTGVIAEPLARFAVAVQEHAKLQKPFGGKAREYLEAAKQAVAVHDDDFRYGPAEGEGYLYCHPQDNHTPLNMHNALARAWIRIDEAAGVRSHRDRIERLARFFKNRMRTDDNGACVWAYRPPLTGKNVGYEDVSHASINADFVTLCVERGIVFTRADLGAVEKTLLQNVLKSDGAVADTLDGRGGGKYPSAPLHWGRLAQHSEAVRRALMDIRRNLPHENSTPRIIGGALLITACDPAMTARWRDVEILGQPCRAKQILGSCVVTDRKDGRERLVLMNDNETYGCELLYIDFEKNTGEVYPAPAGAGSWAVKEVPGDRLVVGTFYDGAFMVFDLVQKHFIKTAFFPGEEYIWNLALGSDGRVYGGTYPSGKLGALNLETYRVDDLGAPAAPNQYLRYVTSTPWGQLLANFGMSESITKIYDIKTKSWKTIADLPAKKQIGAGVTWNNMYVAQDPRTGRLEAFKDESMKPVTPRPFPLQEKGDFIPLDKLTDARNLYLQSGYAIYRCTIGEDSKDLKKIVDIDLRSGAYAGKTKDGRMLGVRGQDYFIVKPGDTTIELKPIPAENRGRPSLFLKADSDGRIWGGPHFGQTIFSYDTRTGKAFNTGMVCSAGGEVYDVTFHEGKVYTASYAGGDITCYDPLQPWDQWNDKNPKRVAHLSSRGYIRPAAGIRTGPDGKLYAGWLTQYGKYGGAVSITDPKTGKTDLIENPCGTQAIESVDVDSKFIYVGTGLEGNGLPNQPGSAKFGVVDVATHKTVFEKPYDVSSINRVTVEPKTSLVVFIVASRLKLFDPKTMAVTESPIPGLPTISAQKIVAAGDGSLITGSGRQILQIDLAAKTFRVIAESPAAVDSITIGSDRRVYFDNGPDLYRTTQPLTTAATQPASP